ncbi:MAG: hypothetical protein FWC42_11065 [Proteobacteria bacterium]|nr:hypothetical protein [Pseudomonadota bacterium]
MTTQKPPTTPNPAPKPAKPPLQESTRSPSRPGRALDHSDTNINYSPPPPPPPRPKE